MNVEVFPQNNPSILLENDIIIDINLLFSEFTGYSKDEVVGLSLFELNKILMITPKLVSNDIDSKPYYYLFSKALDYRCFHLLEYNFLNKKFATYTFHEIPNSRFECNFQFLSKLSDEEIVGLAIYKAPELILLKANHRYLNFNSAPFNSPENTYGKHISHFVTKWENSKAAKISMEVLETGKAALIKEYRDDKSEYLNSVITPVLEGEKIEYLVFHTFEVTESVLNRITIEHQKKELEVIIDSISDGLFILHKDNSIKMLNDSAKAFFYQSDLVNKVEEAMSSPYYYDSEGAAITIDQFPGVRALRGEKVKNYYITAKRPDGIFHFNINENTIYQENENISFALICVHDVTDHINHEEIVKKDWKKLSRIFSGFDLPMARLSYPELSIIDYNDKYYDLIETLIGDNLLGLGDIYKRSFLEFIQHLINEEDFSNIVKKVEENEDSTYLREIKMIIGEREMYFNIICHPTRESDNKISELLITLVDVTKEVLEKSEIQKKMKMQDEFFSFIAHEFRTPLTTISSVIQLLDHLYEKEMTPKIKRYVNTIKRSTFQQLRLVNNLLDITRAEAGYLKVHKINTDIVFITKVIVDSIRPFAKSKGCRLIFKSEIKEKIVALDDEKYERIILNLLSNGIKFTPAGRSICITLSSQDNKTCICIKDSGIGIPKDKQSAIFERFEQSGTKRSREGEGTGIGLYLVKVLVESMGGRITLKSEEGKGSTFKLVMPDVTLPEEENDLLPDLINNRLIESMNMEFSDIYFI